MHVAGDPGARVVPPPPEIGPPDEGDTLKSLKNSPLTEQEEAYFAKFNIHKTIRTSQSKRQIDLHIEHFFKAMYSSERHKWQYILENFIMMDLIMKHDVKQAFLQSETWQEKLVPCLARQSEQKASGEMGKRDEQTLFAMTINIFEVLFYFELVEGEKPGGLSKMFKKTLRVLAQQCGWGFEVRMVASVLLISFLKKIGNQTRPFKRTLYDNCWSNLNDVLLVYDEFFFFSPCRRITNGQDVEDRRGWSMRKSEKEGPWESYSFTAYTAPLMNNPGVHLDANGCADIPIAEQVVLLLNRDLRVHSMKNKISGEKQHAKLEKKLIDQFEAHLKFYTQVLMYFKRVNAVAKMASSGKDTAERRKNYQQSAKELEKESRALVKIIEKKNKTINKPKLKEALYTILDQIFALQKQHQAHKLGRIAKNLYYGQQVETVDWKEFGQMTMKLANLATATRNSLRKTLTRPKSASTPKSPTPLQKSIAQKKDESKRYILTDMFSYGEDQLAVQFFVPHLKENSKVKLLLDHSKRLICVKFFLDDGEDSKGGRSRSRSPSNSRSRSRSSSGRRAKKYILRETKRGLLQKMVKMPPNVDLQKKPTLKQQSNSVTITFACKKG